jgi:membrane-associated phospholipid phosphatase
MSRVVPWLVAAIALTIFVAVTVAAAGGGPTGLDADAFKLARDLRSPALDDAARIVTVFGLLAVVGPAVAVGAVILVRSGHLPRAVVLVAGAALTSAAVWLVKALSGRARPPHPLVHTTGESYPSAHAANSIGWIALALALGVLLPTRVGRVGAAGLATLLALLVGLSRVYLRAHYLTDVLGGESLAVTMYGVSAIGVRAGTASGRSRRGTRPARSPGR